MHPDSWNPLIASLPNPHLLQTWEWSQVKSHIGWQPIFLYWDDAGRLNVVHNGSTIPSGASARSGVSARNSHFGPKPWFGTRPPLAAALLLKRILPAGGFAARMSLLYLPKGPCLDWSDQTLRQRVLDDLQDLARRQGAIFVKIDPDVPLGRGIPGHPGSLEDPLGQEVLADLQKRAWRFSAEQIQFRNTMLIDLTPAEGEILKRMKQKTRYNLRLAERKGVTVRCGNLADLDLLNRMYAETSLRDGFAIRDPSYYRLVWSTFMSSPGKTGGTRARIDLPIAEPLIAEVEGEPVAAVIVFRYAGRAWYLYGMSRQAHREKMPNHLLQWEAIRRAKAAGCTVYDLWGAPDIFDESDPLWGVYRFKEGLGGEIARTIGAWDYPARPLLYRLYAQTLPRLLDWMRQRGRARTRQIVGI